MTHDECTALTIPEILDRLRANYELLSIMVGTLYPQVVYAENVLLRARYLELTGKVCPI